MTKKPRLLIVIADGEHGRIVRPRADNVLQTERRFDSSAAHKQSADLGTDHPGASFHSDASSHHSLAPRHDLHELEKQKFARFVAHQVNELPEDEDFDALVLVAPAESLNIMAEELNVTVRAKLVGRLDKDLVKVPDADLEPHLSEFVRPGHPARKI